LIRTETTINNPKSLGLQKPVLYLQACLWTGLGCNDRLLNCCADVDLSSICSKHYFKNPVISATFKIMPVRIEKRQDGAGFCVFVRQGEKVFEKPCLRFFCVRGDGRHLFICFLFISHFFLGVIRGIKKDQVGFSGHWPGVVLGVPNG
jgi:hypothetical protein